MALCRDALLLVRWERLNYIFDVFEEAVSHLVLLEDRLELAAADPNVFQGLFRGQAHFRVNYEAFLEKKVG